MTILCNMFLIVVALLSVSIFPLWVSSHNLLGADRIAGPVVFFFLGAFRWLCLSVAVVSCASQGAFTNRGRGGVTVALVITFAILEIVALFLSSEGAAGHPSWLADLIVLMSVAMPLPLAGYLCWWLDFRPHETVAFPWVRWLAIGCSVGFALIGLALGSADDRMESQREKDPAYVAAKYLESRTIEYRRMRLDDPGDSVGRWLAFTGPEEPASLRAEALASIAARPHLVSELGRAMLYLNLYDSIPPVRYLAEMKPAPSEELVEPFRQYAANVIGRMHKELAAGELDKYFSEAAEAAVLGARVLRPYQVDIRSELLQMAALLRARNTDRTRTAVAAIDDFLASR
jgi:hypothetical protein